MANLYITEFSNLSRDSNYGTGIPIAAGTLPSIGTQKVTISGTSTQSATLNASTRYVRVTADTTCHIVAGTDPTATTGNMRLVADGVEYFAVLGGQKIAVIQGA